MVTRTGKQAAMVGQLLEEVEKKLRVDTGKATLGDYIKLVQLQKELDEDEPREIRVTWVEPAAEKTESGSEE